MMMVVARQALPASTALNVQPSELAECSDSGGYQRNRRHGASYAHACAQAMHERRSGPALAASRVLESA